MSVSKVSVCIPCLNEEKTIAKVIADWRRALPDADIIVYDNGSIDRTAKEARKAGVKVQNVQKAGKGNVIRHMFTDETAECLIMVDGDDTYGTECAKKMAKDVLEHQADMSVGTRAGSFVHELSLSHRLGNSLVRALVNHFFQTDYSDVMSGCRAFSKRFRTEFPASCGGFETETEMNIFAGTAGMKVTEHDLTYHGRKTGSKVRTLSDGLKITFFILREATRWKLLEKKEN